MCIFQSARMFFFFVVSLTKCNISAFEFAETNNWHIFKETTPSSPHHPTPHTGLTNGHRKSQLPPNCTDFSTVRMRYFLRTAIQQSAQVSERKHVILFFGVFAVFASWRIGKVRWRSRRATAIMRETKSEAPRALSCSCLRAAHEANYLPRRRSYRRLDDDDAGADMAIVVKLQSSARARWI